MGKLKTNQTTDDEASEEVVESGSSNSPCKIITNNDNLERDKIEYYHLPSFKTESNGLIYRCIHCSQTYYDSTTVKDHLGAVHCDFHYYCEYCGEFFSTSWQLKRHLKSYAYYCKYCDYCTDHYSQFRLHNSRAHKVKMKVKHRTKNKFLKAYECDICGYQVLRPHMHKKHMKTVHDKDVDT